MTIRVSVEAARGCGYRKEGGLYLMGGKLTLRCGRMPYPLHVCAACGHGIKPTRGWTWIDPVEAFDHEPGSCGQIACASCPLGGWMAEAGRCGLLWIGGAHYKTPEDFNREQASVGISRRITAVPKDLELGETWVFLAHREAIATRCETCDGTGVVEVTEETAESPEAWAALSQAVTDGTLLGDGRLLIDCDDCRDGMQFEPGIFSAFVPDRIEKVVSEDCSEEEAEKLRKRGIEPVIVKRADEDVALDFEDDPDPGDSMPGTI